MDGMTPEAREHLNKAAIAAERRDSAVVFRELVHAFGACTSGSFARRRVMDTWDKMWQAAEERLGDLIAEVAE